MQVAMRRGQMCNEAIHTLYLKQQVPFRLKRFLMTKLMHGLRKVDNPVPITKPRLVPAMQSERLAGHARRLEARPRERDRRT